MGMKLLQKTALALIRIKLKVLAVISPKTAAASAFHLFCTPRERTLGELPAVFNDAEVLHTTFNNLRIRGYRWNRGKAPRAMILHGFESSVINFESYISALVKKGYEVIALDAPAHGKSEGSQINALVYRDFITAMQKEYGVASRYVAHSFGGLALCLAVADMPSNAELRLALIAPATETKTVVEQFLELAQITNPAVIKEFLEIIYRLSGHDLDWFSITRAMKTIQSRVLWTHDRGDRVTPFRDLGPIREANYPNVQFVFTNGLGHRRIYRDPQVRQSIIEFL